ncbi:MAG: iron-containing alcohol dehydrogenase [Oceanospirillales bacterium]|nr:iron-containing alcohol dehydrogenase [Oceanospirillales bacterium]MCH1501197.1 iron-containing alcohol dehydrogenase [Litorivicinaceae bacterium]
MFTSSLRAPPVEFQRGICQDLAPILASCQLKRVVIVHGTLRTRVQSVIEQIRQTIDVVAQIEVHDEPSLPALERHLQGFQGLVVDGLIAIGGGSVLDMTKALAGLIPAKHPVMTYLEVVGDGRALEQQPLPWIAIPTTAGTGSEMTKNAVIDIPDAQRKVSLRDSKLLPAIALVDPAFTDDTPKAVTLACGLDAVTQCIEPYLSNKRSFLTDSLVEPVIPRALQALHRLMSQETSEDRDTLAYTSMIGGVALANSGLGVVHGFAGPLGSMTGAAHGAICGALLPYGLKVNRHFADDPIVIQRLDQIANWIIPIFGGMKADAFDTLAAWIADQGITGLASLGLKEVDIRAVATASQASSSMKANPVALPLEALVSVLEEAL